MSEMFDNYQKEYNEIPDNRVKFLKLQCEYSDVLTIGASNNHNIKIPKSMDEILDLNIRYYQGTEKIIDRTYYIDEFIPVNIDYENEYIYYDGSFLYAVGDEDDFRYCIIYYPISEEESRQFNDYNKEVYAQVSVTLKNGSTEISDLYKIEVKKTLFKEENKLYEM